MLVANAHVQATDGGGAGLSPAPKPTRPPGVAGGDIDLAAVRDVDELVAMGSPRLKAALRARGMRAGGSAPLLAERLWWKCKLSATNSPKFSM